MRDPGKNFKRIAIINFGQLGDVVLGLPAVAAIRRHFPQAHITTLTGKAPGEVMRLTGLADEVIAVDRVELRDGPKLRSIASILRFTNDFRRRPLDLIIDLHSLPETNILARLSRARYRLLANRENRSIDRLSNFRPRPRPEDRSKPLTDRYFDVIAPLGVTDEQRQFRFDPSPAALSRTESLFAGLVPPVVGLFPGAGHPSRCWPLDRFRALAESLIAEGRPVAVFLGPEEAGMRDRVSSTFHHDVLIVDGLSIAEFIAAASRLAVLVTNDTGPMHLAACAGAAIVLLLDERAPTTYLPLTEDLTVLRQATIDNISVDEALAAVHRRLGPDPNDNRPPI